MPRPASGDVPRHCTRSPSRRECLGARVAAAAAIATLVAVHARRPAMDASFKCTLRLKCLRHNRGQACNSQSSVPSRRLYTICLPSVHRTRLSGSQNHPASAWDSPCTCSTHAHPARQLECPISDLPVSPTRCHSCTWDARMRRCATRCPHLRHHVAYLRVRVSQHDTYLEHTRAVWLQDTMNRGPAESLVVSTGMARSWARSRA